MDESGIAFLDTRNNVAHVGHCHPHVIQAVQEQVATLNTNTRYLHPNMALLAQRLATLLPDPLEVVFFCNSGSEANDMALRLARAYSSSSSVNTIVVDGAYHGHTCSTLEVSPYKFEHSKEYSQQQNNKKTVSNNNNVGTPGRHIWKVPCPDIFRGEFCDIATAGALYASHVEEACRFYQAAGEQVRAFIVEGTSISSAFFTSCFSQ